MADMSRAKDYYTVKEFAELLGYSTDRVYEWLHSGYIEYYEKPMPHSIWRIPKTELERLKGKASEVAQSIVPKVNEKHLGNIHDLLKALERNIRYQMVNRHPCVLFIYEVEDDRLFPCLLQHCPSINNCYQNLKALRADSKHLLDLDHKYSHEIFGRLIVAEANGELGSWIYEDVNSDLLVALKSYLLFGEHMNLLSKLKGTNRSSPRKPRDIFQYGPDKKSADELRQFVVELARKNPESSLKDRILKEVEALYESEFALLDTVETSIISNEYLRNKCEWCP